MVDPREEMIERLVLEKRELSQEVEQRDAIIEDHAGRLLEAAHENSAIMAQRDEALSALRNIGAERASPDAATYARTAVAHIEGVGHHG